ncbi:helix-turn-helix domain-containing protein [Pseudomonas putida]|uniref:helix-turn-helix domain-containing protein n=1 Tax=Pseudomonas putida TaxID=303 RepID=UPI003570FF2E
MKKLQPQQRAQLVEEIAQRNAAGLDSIGASIRRLRLEITGLDQETFATMCKISTKSLYELESGKSNPKLGTLEAVLRLFGLRMGIVLSPRGGINPSSLTETPAQAKPKRGKSPAAAKAKRGGSRQVTPKLPSRGDGQ